MPPAPSTPRISYGPSLVPVARVTVGRHYSRRVKRGYDSKQPPMQKGGGEWPHGPSDSDIVRRDRGGIPGKKVRLAPVYRIDDWFQPLEEKAAQCRHLCRKQTENRDRPNSY